MLPLLRPAHSRTIVCTSTRSHLIYRRFATVDTLPNGDVETFRWKAFDQDVPAVLPRGHFVALPALTQWFERSPLGDGVSALKYGYLDQHGDAMVPLELTKISKESASDSFQRLQAPLSLFLAWTRNANQSTLERVYLAQCQLLDLPQALRNDLPTPDIVAKAGKGDIYDTNLWIGVAPTYTPLHRDPNPNLFVQLAGTKLVRLYPPDKGSIIFEKIQEKLGRSQSSAIRGHEMMEGAEKAMLEHQVWQSDGHNGIKNEGLEVRLDAGDGIFIPTGWWHSIKGVGKGITGSVRRSLLFGSSNCDLMNCRSIGGFDDIQRVMYPRGPQETICLHV